MVEQWYHPLSKLPIIEKRLMHVYEASHEFVRMLLIVWDEFDENGDETWLVRQTATELSIYVRSKMRLYTRGQIEPLVRLSRSFTIPSTSGHQLRSSGHEAAGAQWYVVGPTASQQVPLSPGRFMAGALRLGVQ